MRTLLSFVRLAALSVGMTGGLTACGGSVGKLAVDSPVLPYQPPDISEITGIPEPDDSDSAEPAK